MNTSRSFEDFEEKHLDLKIEDEFHEEESQVKDDDSFPSSSSSFRMKFVEAQMVDSISDISDNIFPIILEKVIQYENISTFFTNIILKYRKS